MTNEEKILAILVQIQGDIAELKDGQVKLEKEQASMKSEMNERFDTLEDELKYAWQDIELVEKRVQQHEKEFHMVG